MKISAAVESVIVEDKKIVKLEFQITNARYRRGFDVKTANDQEHTKKKTAAGARAVGVAADNRFGEGEKKKNVGRARGGSHD